MIIRHLNRIHNHFPQYFNRKFSIFTKCLSPGLSYLHRQEGESLKYLTFGQCLQNIANRYPDRHAIVSCIEKSTITFAEVLDKSDRLASSLLNLGLNKGDRVGIWSPNYEFWYISMMAIARAGLTCVALNPAYTIPELEYCIKKVDIKAIIAPESFRNQKHYDMLTNLIPSMRNSKSGTSTWTNGENSLQHVIIKSDQKLAGAISYDELLKVPSESDMKLIKNLQSSISPDSGCNVQFSSGTTGKPKAALLSHYGMINNGYDVGLRQEFHKMYARVCLNNPLFHVYGCVIAIANSLCHGSTLVFPSPHFSPSDSLTAIVSEKCNVIYGTPTMFVDLVAKQREMNVKLPKIELANTGGSVCTPQLVKDVVNVLNVKKFKSVYGLTETSAVVFQSLPSDKNESVMEYVGVLNNNLEAKVVDENGITVPFGVPGELWIRGYLTMLGYWNDKKKTDEVMGEDDWLKTGDQFILYENYYGKISGRLKEMIIRGGENLFPREIEDFLNTHENILEAHVIGIPDERLGEEVGAFIRLKDPSKTLTRQELKEFCSGKLAHFKIPRYLFIVDGFPKTISGKIQKFRFTEVFADKMAKRTN